MRDGAVHEIPDPFLPEDVQKQNQNEYKNAQNKFHDVFVHHDRMDQAFGFILHKQVPLKKQNILIYYNIFLKEMMIDQCYNSIMKYYSLNDYLKTTYGEKIYKIAINGGFTCPNRDGTLGTGGCIFCSGQGSGEFAEDSALSVTEQIERGKKRVAEKIKDGRYIAYFQAFTNTYAPIKRLRELFTEAINHPDVAILSVATRPDCLPDEVVSLLMELNRIKPVWVELGLQTIHEKTAEYIRRGYPLPVFDDAVKRLKAAGLDVIVHVILCLPGESEADMQETVKYVIGSGVDGIKLQLLQVLKGTDLAADYLAGKFTLPTPDEYCDLILKCLRLIPDHVVVHRLTGDGDKKLLIAPKWCGDKKRVLNTLRQKIEEA